ncbi:MAG: hypothetical protein E5Y55_29485 [Mesorhizobium sp.]|nr:MAG: hypothetical protein E5Y82_24650 [Mesorhizobium sp.]TIM39902.1 MAG: hypothetical protein E5Y55_29485 [Mesorhizobium sp.]
MPLRFAAESAVDLRCRPVGADKSPTLAIGINHHDFVILGRSKERSDAAQTLGSMPLPCCSAPAEQDQTLPRPSQGRVITPSRCAWRLAGTGLRRPARSGRCR